MPRHQSQAIISSDIAFHANGQAIGNFELNVGDLKLAGKELLSRKSLVLRSGQPEPKLNLVHMGMIGR